MKIWLYVITIGVVLILFSLIVLTTVQLFKIKQLKKTQNQLNAKLNGLLQSEEYYENANAYVRSNDFIEQYARDALGLGREGDEEFNS